jgi:hypothetical protein
MYHYIYLRTHPQGMLTAVSIYCARTDVSICGCHYRSLQNTPSCMLHIWTPEICIVVN